MKHSTSDPARRPATWCNICTCLAVLTRHLIARSHPRLLARCAHPPLSSIERWLLDAQRLKKRACPTCKSNPLEVVEPAVHGPRSSTTTSAQSSNVDLNDQVAEDLTGPAGPGVALT
eukprot:1658820-Prymnesium_polylepis.1